MAADCGIINQPIGDGGEKVDSLAGQKFGYLVETNNSLMDATWRVTIVNDGVFHDIELRGDLLVVNRGTEEGFFESAESYILAW